LNRSHAHPCHIIGHNRDTVENIDTKARPMMRTNLCLLALLLALRSFAQSADGTLANAVIPSVTTPTVQNGQTVIGKYYKTGLDMTVYIDDDDGDPSNDQTRTLKAGMKYRIVKREAGHMYIAVVPIVTKGDEFKGSDRVVNSTNSRENYYALEAGLVELNTLQTNGSITGSLFLPVKFRGQLYKEEDMHRWQLSTDISLGGYFGYRFVLARQSPVYMNVVGLLGPSLLNPNSDNTGPEVEQTTLLGLTAAAGLDLEIEGIQIGFIYGRDFAPGEQGQAWIYNEENWFSFGIGPKFLGAMD